MPRSLSKAEHLATDWLTVGHQRFRTANICANLVSIRGKNLSEQFSGDCVLIRNSHDA